jgi:hypothetical protein
MRNATSTHLLNAEVQFGFPADDVQEWVSRPTLSRTPLVPLLDKPTAPWRKAFRWRIPHLPSGDSVEFTFRAVAPSSDAYEAALYHAGVVFERIIGEPPPRKKGMVASYILVGLLIGAFAGVLILALSGKLIQASDERLTTIRLAGCDLNIVSFYDLYGQHYHSPWRIKYRIFNVGAQDCVLQSKELEVDRPVTLKAGDLFEKEWVSKDPPTLTDVQISVGAVNAAPINTTAPAYLGR